MRLDGASIDRFFSGWTMAETTRAIDLGVGGLRAGMGDHIAYFWEEPAEFRSAVGFLVEGLRSGDHVVVFGHADANDQVCAALDALGHDCAALESQGQLSILGPRSTGDRILEEIGQTFQQAVDGGAPMVRLLGNIGWGRAEWPDQRDLLRFESQVTGAAASFPCVVMCMYDVNSLEGSVVFHGAFCTHPLTIYRNNLVRENPMCMGVEDFLARLDAGAEPSAS